MVLGSTQPPTRNEYQGSSLEGIGDKPSTITCRRSENRGSLKRLEPLGACMGLYSVRFVFVYALLLW